MRAQLHGWWFVAVALLAGCVGTSQTPRVVAPTSTIATATSVPSPQPQTDGAVTPFYQLDSPLPTPFVPPVVPPKRIPPVVTPFAGSMPVVERAIADLALRLGVGAGQIEVVRVFADEFPIQNLGCPLPGSAEPEQPAFVMGSEIVLAVGDRQVIYRARGSALIFCGERP